jgi:hypothetical protein
MSAAPASASFAARVDAALADKRLKLAIEGTLVRGAHGPGWLHIVLFGQYSYSPR